MKEEAIAVTIIKKLLVELLSLGSIPNEAKAGFVIIPPPIPKDEETIPAMILMPTTNLILFSTFCTTSDLKFGINFFFFSICSYTLSI